MGLELSEFLLSAGVSQQVLDKLTEDEVNIDHILYTIVNTSTASRHIASDNASHLFIKKCLMR